MKRFTSAEAVIDAAAHRVLARLPQSGICGGLVEFLVFGIKQAWRVWYLLMIISVVLVTWVHPPRGKDEPDDQANS